MKDVSHREYDDTKRALSKRFHECRLIFGHLIGKLPLRPDGDFWDPIHDNLSEVDYAIEKAIRSLDSIELAKIKHVDSKWGKRPGKAYWE